jgi:hypothetical protein
VPSRPLVHRDDADVVGGAGPAEGDAATERELAAQMQLRSTADFREGVAAMAERRLPRFVGK